jgi:hypothetical protein
MIAAPYPAFFNKKINEQYIQLFQQKEQNVLIFVFYFLMHPLFSFIKITDFSCNIQN